MRFDKTLGSYRRLVKSFVPERGTDGTAWFIIWQPNRRTETNSINLDNFISVHLENSFYISYFRRDLKEFGFGFFKKKSLNKTHMTSSYVSNLAFILNHF